MALIMNNTSVKSSLNDCQEELNHILVIIDSMGRTSNFVPYLTKYSIIKACGAIERAYKDIISDFCVTSAPSQVRNYIEKSFRTSSSNPSLHNIQQSLNKFDPEWSQSFESTLDDHPNKSQFKTSLKSLVMLRNNLAHGGNPTASIDNVLEYFKDSYEIMKILDNVVNQL